MKTIIIDKNEGGITLIKFLKKIFKNMPDSLLQRLIRKKYFEINSNKSSGKDVLKENDTISIYLSDNTFEKFYSANNTKSVNSKPFKKNNYINRIIYEDDNIIIFNKPVGLLSQSDGKSNESVNTVLNNYIGNGSSVFKPSVVNRLDRNTEGLIIFAKTYIAAKEISEMIKNNSIEKRYIATVNGRLEENEGELVNLLKKNEKDNIAIIKEYAGDIIDGYSLVKLRYIVMSRHKDTSDVEIELITGKSHQIRAQFAFIGHPLICDKKYMDINLYNKNVSDFGLKSQKLKCYKIVFGRFENESLNYLSNRIFEINI